MIVCAAANPSVDATFEVERLLPGRVHRPSGLARTAGGKSLNVARAGGMLGEEPRVIALLGGSAGNWIAAELEREGIAAEIIWGDWETRTCMTIADRASGELTDLYEAGGPVDAEAWKHFRAAVLAAAAGAEWLVLSGSLPPGIAPDAYADLLAAARAAGAAVALDASGEALVSSLPAGPTLLKVNEEEAAEALGGPIDSGAGAVLAARELVARGAELEAVIITRGREGAVLVLPDGTAWEGEVPLPGAYPVGSGDCFLAGLLSARRLGLGWPAALSRAIAAATANAQVPGAARFDPDLCRRLEAGIELRSL